MTDKYTPTVEEVRDQWASSPRYGWAVMLSDRFADFDRMIAEVERAAAVKALREAGEASGRISYPAYLAVKRLADLIESGESA
jgi:hypothetical protein